MGGGSFAAGLLSSFSQAYGQKRKDDQDREEQEREGALRILDLAAHSPNLNPEDYPTLIQKMLEIHGAKGKDVDQAVNTVSALFNPGTTERPGQIKQPVKRMNGASMADTTPGENVTVGNSSLPIESPPQMNYVPPQRTAGVRFLSPQEMSQRDIQDKVDEQSALLPVLEQQNKIRTQGQVEVEQAKAKGRLAQLNVQLDSKLKLLDQKQRFDLTKKRDSLAQSFISARPDLTPEQAQELAGQQILDEASSKVEYRQAQIKAIPQRIQLMKERNDIARQNSLNGMSKPQTTLFSANTRELFGELGTIRSQISQIENGKLTGTLIDDDEADSRLADLEKRQEQVLSQINSVRNRVLGQGTPQASTPRGKYAGQRISRAKLPEAARRLNMTAEQAEQYLTNEGAVLY
jgi:hypothetical protein